MEALAAGRLKLGRHREEPLPVVALGELGSRGLVERDISGEERAADGMPSRPFDIPPPAGPPTHSALWGHDAVRERLLVVAPDSEGLPRAGCWDRAAQAWERTASRLHFDRDFRMHSQSLAAFLTAEPEIGGTPWPSFLMQWDWDEVLVPRRNATLGLMALSWSGPLQQQGSARITISRLPDLVEIDPRGLGTDRILTAKRIFEEFREAPLLPANEAYRDAARQASGRVLLVDWVGLSESVLELRWNRKSREILACECSTCQTSA